MRTGKAIALVTGTAIALVAGVVVAGFVLLVLGPPANRSPEVRLLRLTRLETPPGDVLESLNRIVESSPETWTAVFEIRNSGRGVVTIDLGRNTSRVEIVDHDSQIIATQAHLAATLPGMDMMMLNIGEVSLRSNQSMWPLKLSVSPESRTCRFRIIYWPMTARERWVMSNANKALARRYPSIYKWVWLHLPGTPRKFETIQEVRLPAEPEVLPAKGTTFTGRSQHSPALRPR